MTLEPKSEPQRAAAPDNPAALSSSGLLGRVVVFAIYSMLYEAIVWGIFGWAVFVQDRSGWWMLLAALLSSAQLKPQHFGIWKRPNSRI